MIYKFIEGNNCYPFGLKHKGYNSNINGTHHKYMFGGKEFDESFQTLNTYDFGARNYDPALGRWMNLDPLAEKYVNFTPYSYTANNPVFFVDKNGKEIYIITQNNEVTKATKIIQKTTIGKQLWDKYGRNDNHDIYISAQEFTENKASALTYAYSRNIGLVTDNTVNISKHYKSSPYTKDFSSFNGLDVSKSKGKNIHLVSLNEKFIEDDGKKGKRSFNGAAYKIFHEIDAHITQYTNGDKNAEHVKFGLVEKVVEIEGKKVNVISVRKGSNAWKIVEELLNLRTQENNEDKEND